MRSKTTIFVTAFLLAILCGCTGGDMLAELERLEEQNRSDQPFTSDSAARRIVDYYDRWYRLPTAANRNLQMRAYYMLGSAYRDMGEAPAALHYYNIATQQPDTNNIDSANAATLFRIYGQMAMIYGQQDMPVEKREAIQHYKHYALMAGDTLSYIIAYEQMTDVCYQIDDTLGVYNYTDSAYMLYRRYGYDSFAARVYPTAIYVSLLNNDSVKARYYMNVFERESGLFDEQGNIVSGREHYYYSKGLYSLATGKQDSAVYFFRRLVDYGYLYEAYRGLLSVYRLKENADSIVKYSRLFEDAVLQWETQRQTDAIIQTSAMYKYERSQNIAIQKTRDAQISHYIIVLLFGSLAIIVISSLLVYNGIRQRRLKEELEYRRLVEEHMAIQIKCQNQEEQICTFRQDVIEKEAQLGKEDIVVYFHEMAQNRYNGNLPTKKDWQKLIRTYSRYMPHIYARMQVAKLTDREQYACILAHLDFSASDLTVLLDTSKQIVSNARLSAKRKLFGCESDISLVQSLKKCAYFQM